jgi:hypothetical protein
MVAPEDGSMADGDVTMRRCDVRRNAQTLR